jgi:hypothetical protein
MILYSIYQNHLYIVTTVYSTYTSYTTDLRRKGDKKSSAKPTIEQSRIILLTGKQESPPSYWSPPK